MFAQERQDCIVEKVNQEGSVRVKDLSIEFEVTDDCIRKDLAILEKKGLLKKAYGGAVRMKENPHLYKSADRKNLHNEERVMIAQKAISLLHPQDTIFLDISLASVEIAKQLQNSEMKLTVMTNMIEILNLLCQCSHISLVFIGGQLNDEGDGFWGSYSAELVHSFKIDQAFLGVVGIDALQGQVSTYYIDDGMMKKAILEQSQKSYLLCEERKFVEYGNYVFCSLNDINGLIVSKELNQKLKLSLEEYGLSVI